MFKWYIKSGETWVGSMNINCKPATRNSILGWIIQLLINKSTANINLLTFWTQEGQTLRVCPKRLLCGEHTDNMFISERKWSTADSRKPTTGVRHWLQKNLRRSTVGDIQNVAFRLTYWRVKTSEKFKKNTEAQVLCKIEVVYLYFYLKDMEKRERTIKCQIKCNICCSIGKEILVI